MTEPSAEAREQIADHLREHSWVPCTNRGEAMPSGPWCSKCIARALAEKDAKLTAMRGMLERLYGPAKIASTQIICMGGEGICQPCENREHLCIVLEEVGAALLARPEVKQWAGR